MGRRITKFTTPLFLRIRNSFRNSRAIKKTVIILLIVFGIPALAAAAATWFGHQYRDNNVLKPKNAKVYAKDLPKIVESGAAKGDKDGYVSIQADKLPNSIAQALAAPAATIIPQNQAYADNASGGDPSTPPTAISPPQQQLGAQTTKQLTAAVVTILNDWDTYDNNIGDFNQRTTRWLTGKLSAQTLQHNDDLRDGYIYPGGGVQQTFLPAQVVPTDPLTGMRVLLYQPGAVPRAYVTINGYVHRASARVSKYDDTWYFRGYGLVLEKTSEGWRALRIAAGDRFTVDVDALPNPAAVPKFERSDPTTVDKNVGQSQ